MSRLVEAIDLSKLTDEGLEFQIDADFVRDHKSDEEDEDLLVKKFDQLNKECIGVFDEDTYEEGEPFELIAKKMFNLLPDGRIKKRVIREGDGEQPQKCASVKIHYNSYAEHQDEPFDSTYVRSKPYKFIVDDGRVIAGLDFGVQSMKENEKSQFLIHPDYAYGKNSLIGRIPQNGSVLFEVELLEVVNSGAAVTFDRLSETEQGLFSEVYKYSVALNERAKKTFMNGDYEKAVVDYNKAAAKLEKVILNNKEEAQQHHEIALKVYSNLLICYTRLNEARKGCVNAKKIYDLVENGGGKVHPKVFFNHAKCLRFLGEYVEAKVFLNKAFKLEPKNPEIANEMLNLEIDRKEHRETLVMFAKALVGGNK